nr:MAG TPA: hypothetical protein [Caudoviricetes sp.]
MLRRKTLAKGLHKLTNGLNRCVVGQIEGGLSLFFLYFMKKINSYFIPYKYYLVYLHHKNISYGKSYTRTFDTRIKANEAERLVFQQHFCRLYCIYA